MKSFFDPGISQIIDLIQGQIQQVEGMQKQARVGNQGKLSFASLLTHSQAVLNIGDLSENEYIQQQLTNAISDKSTTVFRLDKQ